MCWRHVKGVDLTTKTRNRVQQFLGLEGQANAVQMQTSGCRRLSPLPACTMRTIELTHRKRFRSAGALAQLRGPSPVPASNHCSRGRDPARNSWEGLARWDARMKTPWVLNDDIRANGQSGEGRGP